MMDNPLSFKHATPAFVAAQGGLLLVLGILLIVNPDYSAVALRWIAGLAVIVSAFPHAEKAWKQGKRVIACISAIVFALIGAALIASTWLFNIATSLIFGFMFIVLGLARLEMFGQCFYDKTGGKVRHFTGFLISVAFGVALIVQPSTSPRLIALVAGIFMIIYAASLLFDACSELFLDASRAQRIKRVVRIPLPVVLTAMLPGETIDNFNEYFKTTGRAEGMVVQSLKNADGGERTELEILIHMSGEGAGRMGHVDIRFGDELMSYGIYDSHSLKLWGLVCDGTFVVSDFAPYMRNCIEVEKKLLVGYGIALDEQARAGVVARIAEIKSRFIPFESDYELWKDGKIDHWDETDFTNKLVRDTGCKLYKVPRGPFHTYIAINTNCVKLVDTIIKASGLDGLAVNGIPTPGSYLDNLNYLFERKNPMVVTRTIYSGEIDAAR